LPSTILVTGGAGYIGSHDVKYLRARGESAAFNPGNGAGHSIRQVIDTARRVTGRDFPVERGPRREGDAATLVADSRQARAMRGWAPADADLERIVADAWAWEQQKGVRW